MGDEIITSLFLGGLDDLENEKWIEKTGITHVLSIIDKFDVKTVTSQYTQKIFLAADDDYENLLRYFNEGIKFIDDAIQKGGKIFVHCAMGMSRSPTIVIAYLMVKMNLDPKEAFHYVKKRRPIINPRAHFIKQLWAFHLCDGDVKEETYSSAKYINLSIIEASESEYTISPSNSNFSQHKNIPKNVYLIRAKTYWTENITFSGIVYVYLNEEMRNARRLLMENPYKTKDGKTHELELTTEELEKLSYNIQKETLKNGFFYNNNMD
jgi:protein-tyrosine phosphatase